MKKAIDTVLDKTYDVVAGVDASTKSVAVSIVNRNGPLGMFLIELEHGDIYSRLSSVRQRFIAIMKMHRPEICVIEAPIMVQNPETMKHMAYVIGILFGACLELGIRVQDVPPMRWKSHLGYKALSKHDKEQIIEKMGATDGKAYIRNYNKSSIQSILVNRYPRFKTAISNHDLADSLGVAVYAWDMFGRKK